jgi:hypothetical protein
MSHLGVVQRLFNYNINYLPDLGPTTENPYTGEHGFLIESQLEYRFTTVIPSENTSLIQSATDDLLSSVEELGNFNNSAVQVSIGGKSHLARIENATQVITGLLQPWVTLVHSPEFSLDSHSLLVHLRYLAYCELPSSLQQSLL